MAALCGSTLMAQALPPHALLLSPMFSSQLLQTSRQCLCLMTKSVPGVAEMANDQYSFSPSKTSSESIGPGA